MDDFEREMLEHFRESVIEQFGEEATKIVEELVMSVKSHFMMYFDFLQQEYEISEEDYKSMEDAARKNVVSFIFDTLAYAYNNKYGQPSAN